MRHNMNLLTTVSDKTLHDHFDGNFHIKNYNAKE